MPGARGTKLSASFRFVKGGGTFVWPVLEKVEILSLELMKMDVRMPEVSTSTGLPVRVDGMVQIKVNGDDISVGRAAELFLSKTSAQIMQVALQTLEGHLRAILKSYFAYYHRARTHLSLGKDAPDPRPVQPPSAGEIVAFPEVGGLHHRYERRAA